MDATKSHVLWETDVLDKSLEDLLQVYATSIGSADTGVPSELIQGASRIPAESAKLLAAGPANCTADPDVEQGDVGEECRAEQEATINCVGILDGGVDDITPVQI